MPLFTVRRTKVLRVELVVSIEVEATNQTTARTKAIRQEDDHTWVEIEREQISVHTDVFKEGEGP
jgi:hypothetical protein